MKKILLVIMVVSIIAIIGVSFSLIPEKKSYTLEVVLERTDLEKEINTLNCERSYPDLCIPKNQIDISCDNILEKSFVVKHDDPNNLDPDNNGFGCE